MVGSRNFCSSLVTCIILLSTTVGGASVGDYWIGLKPVPYPLFLSGATVANGVVYAAGGAYSYDLPVNTGTSFVAYFRSNDSWKVLPSMPTPRQTLGVVAIQDKIYTIGGEVIGGLSNKVEVYNLHSSTWESQPPMPIATSGFAYAAINSSIYVMGGVVANGKTRAVWAYDTLTETWSQKAPMPGDLPFGGANGAAVDVGQRIYVAPRNAYGVTTSLVYDAGINQWTDSWNGLSIASASGMTISLDFYALAKLGSRIFIIGGVDENSHSGETSYNFAYDTVSGSWERWKDMPTARFGLVAVTVDGLIYAIGGGGSCEATVPSGSCVANEAYTPSDSHSPTVLNQSAIANPLPWVATIVIAAATAAVFGVLFSRRKSQKTP